MKPDPTDDLHALRDIVEQIDLSLNMPQGPAVGRARELSKTALALVDDLVATPAAVALGKKGGTQTAKRGPEYFKNIAAMRKTRAGGRPKKALDT